MGIKRFIGSVIMLMVLLISSDGMAGFCKKFCTFLGSTVRKKYAALQTHSFLKKSPLFVAGAFWGSQQNSSHENYGTAVENTALTDTILKLFFENRYIRSMITRDSDLSDYMQRKEPIFSHVSNASGVLGKFNISVASQAKQEIITISSEISSPGATNKEFYSTKSLVHDAFTRCKKPLYTESNDKKPLHVYCTTQIPLTVLRQKSISRSV